MPKQYGYYMAIEDNSGNDCRDDPLVRRMDKETGVEELWIGNTSVSGNKEHRNGFWGETAGKRSRSRYYVRIPDEYVKDVMGKGSEHRTGKEVGHEKSQ